MDELNRSYEPMDIDLSTGSIKPMDISNIQASDSECIPDIEPEVHYTKAKLINYEALKKEITSETQIKKYHIKVPTNHQSKLNLPKVIISFILLVTLPILVQHIFNAKCIDRLDLLTVKEVLISKLYGQDAAIELITNTLLLEESKILFIYGSTGIGKTYAISLMYDSLWESANIYHYTAASFEHKITPHLLIGMTFCKSSTFIIDDINYDDLNIKTAINDIIMKSEDLKKNITVILIYNCDLVKSGFIKKCDNSFQQKLNEAFVTIKTKKIFIPFEPLTNEHLKKCIENELGNRKMTADDFDDITQNFNVSSDGCKGVYSKMKFLNLL